MNKNNYFLVICLVISACTLVACEGPVGPEGPEGPEGPQGPVGPEGPRGPEGNANVVADTLTLGDADWERGRVYFQTSPNSSLSRSVRIATLEVPEITEEIHEFGMVQVYLKSPEGFGSSPTVWSPLPYEILAFGSEYYYNLNYTYSEGELKLYYYYTPNSSGNDTPSLDDAELPDYMFKYVITAPATTQSMAKDGVDWDRHDEVMEYLKTDLGFDNR